MLLIAKQEEHLFVLQEQGANCTLEGGALTIAGAITTLDGMTLAIAVPLITNTMVLSASQTIASGTIPADLVLTGNSSPVIKWQSASDSAFTNPTDILLSSTILSGSCIGSLVSTTFYRAVILIDGVPEYSNRVKITINSAPDIGPLSSFVLFTKAGNITNGVGISTNNALIGTNAGAIIGAFSNMSLLRTQNALTLACANYLLPLFNAIKNTPATNSHAAAFVDGETVLPGIYQVASAATLAGIVTLDGLGSSNSKFIIKITGAFAFTAGSQIILTNGALASNVFWVMDGALGIGASCDVKGTFICLAGAIALGNGCTTEGGLFTIAGAITLQNCTLSIPVIATSNQVIPSGTQPQDLTLTGNMDAVVRWEKSSDALFTTPITIANTTTTLLGSQIGTLTAKTYFRAVVTIGSTTLNSNSVIMAVNQATVSVVAGAASSTPTLFINTSLTNITLSTTAATGIGTATGLPAGVTAAWAANTITISGMPTASGIFNYSIPLTGGCGNDATGTITVAPALLVGGTGSPNQSFCSASTPADLILSGNSGYVIKWQSALTSDFAVATDILNTTNTLSGATIGVLGTTTFYRAVVQSCTEPVRYGDFIKVLIAAPTTWNGTSWSDGLPDNTKPAVYSGNYTANENIAACSIIINYGAAVVVNPGFTMTITNELTISEGGSLTFENNASLVQISNAVNSGNITYKRNTVMRKFDYTYIRIGQQW